MLNVCILINVKDSELYLFYLIYLAVCKVYACVGRHGALSTWNVTKHGGRPLMGINLVIDKVGIDFPEYMHTKDVRF